MKLFRKKKKVHNENWRAWDFFDDEDQYGLITYDVTYLDPTTRFQCSHEVSLDLLIPEMYLSEGNFPSPDGHYALLELEDKLISFLQKAAVECMQVVRLTHNGARTFVFEVNDLVNFLETVKKWTKVVDDFEINIEKQEPWMYYDRCKPTAYNWQQIGNQQVIEQLLKNGSNPEVVHKLECSFGGEPTKLEALKTELLEEGGKHLLSEADLLEMEFEAMLDSYEVDPLTYFLMTTAQKHACKFEGWRAAIIKVEA